MTGPRIACRPVGSADGFSIRPVADDEWTVIAWLWQAFRQDLAPVVHGLPYDDGRYQTGPLRAYPSPDARGYLAWRPHPNTGRDSPIGFALVKGLVAGPRVLDAFWVAPAARREGVGRRLALDVLARHDGPWLIGFQHENAGAGAFWRSVARTAFGADGWTERRQPVPGRVDAPADHVVESVVGPVSPGR